MSTSLKTRTDYDLEHLEELQRVGGKTFAKMQTIRKRTFALVMGVLCMAIGLSLAIKKNSVLLALLCCALGALLLVWGIFFYAVTAWTASRAMGSRWEGNEFYFEREEILAVQGKDSSRFPYTKCSELLETERNFYFLMNDGQGLMLDKSNVKGGSADDLRAWLESKSGVETKWVGKKK